MITLLPGDRSKDMERITGQKYCIDNLKNVKLSSDSNIKFPLVAFSKTVKLRGQEYQLELVDTAGQDEFSLVPQSYSMNIDGYVLVYSVTSAKSLEVVKVIHEKLLDMTGKMNLPLVLVGNKTDLRMERAITPEDGKKLAEQWKAAFLETSAKENQKVADIFQTIVYEIEKAEGNIQEKSGCVIS